ncbi:hypothetical protein FACS1894111_13040 [Clostridia bacterium]|nr:hypothetical protein FACS1894111_13040 [Clostridia bacterium]
MDIQEVMHKMIWIGIDGLGAVFIVGALYNLFFREGLLEVISAFGSALCG